MLKNALSANHRQPPPFFGAGAVENEGESH
jgi:hypothetical protein